MFVGRYPLVRFSSSGGILPLPMRAQTAVAPQKRCLEVACQTGQDFLCRAKLTQGPPKAAEVRRCLHRHLLTKQPAEISDAFRQSFAGPPDALLLKHGGGRRSRISARQTEDLIHQLLETAYRNAAGGKHILRDHAPRTAALRTEVALALHLSGFFGCSAHKPRKGAVPVQLPASAALKAFRRRTRALCPV